MKNCHTYNIRNKLSPLKLIIDLLTNEKSTVTVEFLKEVAKQGKVSIDGILEELNGIEKKGNEICPLDEAIDDIIKDIGEEGCKTFKEKNGTGIYGFLNGMQIRNNFHLWSKTSCLSQWFAEQGVYHADDMSACIMKATWCRLNEIKYDMKPDIERFNKHWKSHGIDVKSEYYKNKGE